MLESIKILLGVKRLQLAQTPRLQQDDLAAAQAAAREYARKTRELQSFADQFADSSDEWRRPPTGESGSACAPR